MEKYVSAESILLFSAIDCEIVHLSFCSRLHSNHSVLKNPLPKLDHCDTLYDVYPTQIYNIFASHTTCMLSVLTFQTKRQGKHGKSKICTSN
jgi:hypothetical protein